MADECRPARFHASQAATAIRMYDRVHNGAASHGATGTGNGLAARLATAPTDSVAIRNSLSARICLESGVESRSVIFSRDRPESGRLTPTISWRMEHAGIRWDRVRWNADRARP